MEIAFTIRLTKKNIFKNSHLKLSKETQCPVKFIFSMNTIEIIAVVIASCLAGALLSWMPREFSLARQVGDSAGPDDSSVEKLSQQSAYMAQVEKAMRDSFGLLAADTLQRNSQAFVALAETKLNEKVTEAKGILEGKEKEAIDGLVQPLAKSLERMDRRNPAGSKLSARGLTVV